MSTPTNRQVQYIPVRLNPIAHAIKQQFSRQQRGPLVAKTVLSASLALASVPAFGALEELIVTTQKREQNLQDVPISVQVLDNQTLEQLNIQNFSDYVLFMPSVSFSAAGPGQAQIYMRGVSDGGDGNFSGTNPSVAVYLDEQPVTSIGRNLDVHVYDMARIEAIAGPQGTLYGASSQAGTIRMVTNQPSTDGLTGGYDLGVNTLSDGDPGGSVEGFVNVPFNDKVALRLVGWYVEDGGWIDNVPASQTFSRSGITVQNSGNADPQKNVVEDDTNTLTVAGLRAALKIDFTDNWSGTLGVMAQSQESEGIFADQPETVGQGKVERFYQDNYQDEFTQLALTVNGDVGFGDLVFAGSYLDRDIAYDIDYSSYAEYSAYVEYYYTCVNYDFNNCADPRIQYNNDSTIERATAEIRLQGKGEGRLNWIGGLFYQTNEHQYFNQWHIPTTDLNSGNGNAIPIDRNIKGQTDLYFTTNQVRNMDEIAVFGEVSWDFTDKFTALIGARWFDIEDENTGFVGTRFSCYDPATGNRVGDPVNGAACGAGLKTSDDDTAWKLNVTYRFTESFMMYATYSEGFRPGGINREVGDLADGTVVVPQVYKLDKLTNYELGWKSTFADNRVRFNGAVYYMDWKDQQLTRFDPAVSFVGLTGNIDGSEITGIEGDIDWLAADGERIDWRIFGGASYNNAELSNEFRREGNTGDPEAPKGTDLPFTPDLKYTIGTRLNWEIGRLRNFGQVTYAYTDDSWNDLFIAARSQQASYGIANFSIGTGMANWSADLYVDNFTDENAEIFRYTRGGDDRITANRPRTIGIRFRQRFD